MLLDMSSELCFVRFVTENPDDAAALSSCCTCMLVIELITPHPVMRISFQGVTISFGAMPGGTIKHSVVGSKLSIEKEELDTVL